MSVCSHIAEGDERNTDRDAVRFFFMAKGSLAELTTQLEIGHEVGLVAPAVMNEIRSEIEILAKMLGVLIKSRQAGT